MSREIRHRPYPPYPVGPGLPEVRRPPSVAHYRRAAGSDVIDVYELNTSILSAETARSAGGDRTFGRGGEKRFLARGAGVGGVAPGAAQRNPGKHDQTPNKPWKGAGAGHD